MSVSHSECFDVITAKDGRSALQFCLTCATAAEHYARTTTHHKTSTAAAAADRTHTSVVSTASDEMPCATGLRVYEGAQVLAALLVHFGRALRTCTQGGAIGEGGNDAMWHWVLELGCGCGLAGFTAAHVFRSAHVFFTDAAVDCLAMVRDSAQHIAHCRIDDASAEEEKDSHAAVNDDDDTSTSRVHYTYPLRWCSEGVQTLCHTVHKLVRSTTQRHVRPTLDLIIGSDLMYHRVDLTVLLTTCRQLLDTSAALTSQTSNNERKDNDVVGPYVVLCHFMRLANGHAQLAQAARGLGFGIVAVPLAAFLHDNVVRRRGWGGLEAVVLFRTTASQNIIDSDTTSSSSSGDDEVVARRDVTLLRASLLRRAEEGGAASCAALRELADCLRVYPSEHEGEAGRISPPVQAVEAMEMLHILTE